jgi:hypothetical protein
MLMNSESTIVRTAIIETRISARLLLLNASRIDAITTAYILTCLPHPIINGI